MVLAIKNNILRKAKFSNDKNLELIIHDDSNLPSLIEQFNIFHNIKEKLNKLNVKKSYHSVLVQNIAANVINYHLL